VVKEINQRQLRRCSNCGEYGHWAKDCNEPPKKIDKVKGMEIKEITNSIHGEGNEGNMLEELAYMFEVAVIEVDEPKSWYFYS